MSAPALRSYNPGWLSDDDLVSGFIARMPLFEFLCGELRRAPLHGNVQPLLLIGVRGSGKTTMLKRLAVAIRREAGLADHLIALSFPEELYQLKGLADLWWAACDALAEELFELGTPIEARALQAQIAARPPQQANDPHNDQGLRVLHESCKTLARRPVLLLDNLDFVLDRIDKTGRKTKDPLSQAYWALREALSSVDAPILIGGSARLSEPFVGYDKAFYDFFIPHRLGKLTLEEVRAVFDHLALHNGDESLRLRIRNHHGRVAALYEMTGGNPRALVLIFELLRQGPSGRAVDDFERLLDLTTPYYKARFEELPEQAQVVMHALAMARRESLKKSRFGHTAALIARNAGLETRIVSAQLEVLIRAGVVEKSLGGKNSAAAGRVQYRIGEQLFRLWLQMRSSRRIRQQVIGLTEYLEALFERDEIDALMAAELQGEPGRQGSAVGKSRMQYALGELQSDAVEAAYRKAIELDSAYVKPWINLGDLIAKDANRQSEAEVAFARALELDPEDEYAQWRLTQLRTTRLLSPAAAAISAGDWPTAKQALTQLRSHPELQPGWSADSSFIEAIIAPALRAQQGAWLLSTLRELDFETLAAPLLLAIEALLDKQPALLNDIEPELRRAATRLYQQLRALLA